MTRSAADLDAPFDALERAVVEDLPYALTDIARLTGVAPDFIAKHRVALGLPLSDSGERAFSEADVGLYRFVGELQAWGMTENDILTVARIIGRASASTAEAITEVMFATVDRKASTDLEAVTVVTDAAERFLPAFTAALPEPTRKHLLRLAAEERNARTRGDSSVPRARPMAVAFADLSGSTAAIQEMSTRAPSELAVRLESAAYARCRDSVRVTKLLGDAVMLVSSDPAALASAALDLVAEAAAAADLPKLRVGLAYGPVVSHYGDWYGQCVNLASRITSVAPSGAVACAGDALAVLRGSFRVVPHDEVDLKGFGPVGVCRVEAAERQAGAAAPAPLR